jgi:hypothetical protein
MIFPKTFPFSKLAPTEKELIWISTYLTSCNFKNCKVLEFGCGITSWVINESLKPKIYVAMEHYQQCIIDTLKNVPKINIITTTWHQIPQDVYDFVFIDSSAGYPPGGDGLFRDKAIEFVESQKMINDNSFIMIHDWHARSGKSSRNYLEKNNYKLRASFNDRTGVGIYSK